MQFESGSRSESVQKVLWERRWLYGWMGRWSIQYFWCNWGKGSCGFWRILWDEARVASLRLHHWMARFSRVGCPAKKT